MSHQLVTLIIAGACVLAGLAVAAVSSVPYVALTPGPTLNTLGPAKGRPLIQISGHRTYPTSGHLNLVTVSYAGGPGTTFNIFNALGAWLTPHDAVVPASEIFGQGQTQQQVQQQDTQQMIGSQQDATAAALCYLHIPFQTIDKVQTIVKGMPADGVLRPGDVITAVNGTKVGCRHDLVTMIKDRTPGTPVTLTIKRDGATKTVRVVTKKFDGVPVVGVRLGTPAYVFPFTVKINIPGVGGPSAGMMFALAIIDKLTPGKLTGGKFIAGTGEIDPSGAVAPIGGIQQKMAGARAAGATIFLTPAANCANTAGAVPAGLRLVKVSTLSQAVADLQAINAGRPVPSC
jgi:Lon-like protease